MGRESHSPWAPVVLQKERSWGRSHRTPTPHWLRVLRDPPTSHFERSLS